MIPQDWPDIIRDIYGRIAELDRRFAGRERTGLVTEVNNKERWARVDLGPDPVTGEPMLTAKINWDEPAQGAMRSHTPLAVGEQVAVSSESGDLADARITRRVASDTNKPPNDEHPDGHVRTIGDLTIVEKNGLYDIKLGSLRIRMGNGRVDINPG